MNRTSIIKHPFSDYLFRMKNSTALNWKELRITCNQETPHGYLHTTCNPNGRGSADIVYNLPLKWADKNIDAELIVLRSEEYDYSSPGWKMSYEATIRYTVEPGVVSGIVAGTEAEAKDAFEWLEHRYDEQQERIDTLSDNAADALYNIL